MNEIKKEEFTIQNNNFVEENIKNTPNQKNYAPEGRCYACYEENPKLTWVGHNSNGNTAIFERYLPSNKYENPQHWIHEQCLSKSTKHHEWCPLCKKELDPKSLCAGPMTQEKVIRRNVALRMLEGKKPVIPKRYLFLTACFSLCLIIPGIVFFLYHFNKYVRKPRNEALPLARAIEQLNQDEKQSILPCIRGLVPWMKDPLNEAAIICEYIQNLQLSQADINLVVHEIERLNPDRYCSSGKIVNLFIEIWTIGPNRKAVIDYIINSNLNANYTNWIKIYTDLKKASQQPNKFRTSLKEISKDPIKTILDLSTRINESKLYQLAHAHGAHKFTFPHIVLKEFRIQNCPMILQQVIQTLFPALSTLAPDAFPRLKFQKDQFLPMLDPKFQKMNISQQIELCKMLGRFIFKIWNCPKNTLLTGIHFPPSLFQSICSLSKEELELIEKKFKAKETLPQEILNKITNFVKKDIANSNETSLEDNLQSNEKAEQAALAILHIVFDIYQSMDDKSQWGEFQQISPEALNEEIQGSISHNVFMDSLNWLYSRTKNNQNYLNQWVQESTVNQRKIFVKNITGRTTLKPHSPRREYFYSALYLTEVEGENLPPKFDPRLSKLILSSKYTNYEIFKDLLNKSLEQSEELMAPYE